MNLPIHHLGNLRGYKLDDEDVKEIMDIFGPGLAEHGITFRNISRKEENEEEHEADGQILFISKMADKLQQHKHEMNCTFFHKKPYYMVVSSSDYCRNWKDALIIAKETFKLAGYDSEEYNFEVKVNYSGNFEITITVKE